MAGDSDIEGFGIQIGAGDKLLSRWASNDPPSASESSINSEKSKLDSHSPNAASHLQTKSRPRTESHSKPASSNWGSDASISHQGLEKKPPAKLQSRWALVASEQLKKPPVQVMSTKEYTKGPENQRSSHRRSRPLNHRRNETQEPEQPNSLTSRIAPRNTTKEPRHGHNSRTSSASRDFHFRGIEPEPPQNDPAPLFSWEDIINSHGSWADEEEDYIPTPKSWR